MDRSSLSFYTDLAQVHAGQHAQFNSLASRCD
jgi:hypothetical protein